MTLNLSLGCAPFKIWVKQKEMKQTLEEAARKYADDKCQERGVPKKYRLHFDFDRYDIEQGFKAGAEWLANRIKSIMQDDSLTDGEVIENIHKLLNL